VLTIEGMQGILGKQQLLQSNKSSRISSALSMLVEEIIVTTGERAAAS